MGQPEFPITVQFEDGDTWILESVEEVECSLEWFDTDAEGDAVRVTDKHGRRVRLKVDALRLIVFELLE